MSDYANTEGLIIEIETSAGSADSELKSLTDTLNEFKSAISNSRSFGTFSRNMDKLTTSVAKIDNGMISRLTALSALGTSLQSLNSVKISDTIGKQIEQIGLATLMVTPQALSRLQLLSTTLTGLSALAGFKFPATVANNLQKIVNIATGLDNATITRLKDLVEALMPLTTLAVVDTGNLQTVAQSLRAVSTAANKASQRGRTFNTVMANIRVKTVAAIYALRKVVSVITESLDVYGDYIETLNLFSVSMGEASKSAYEYAETVQDILGIDMTQWMKSQGVFMTLAKGFGIATDRAAVMSQQLTQLAYDISSFYNISVEDAVQKVQSAFSGELEPVRRLGFDLSQAKLQAIALSLGIDESVKSMDQAEKGSLRYYALLTQVTDAQGDLARTLESPTNQLRIFSAQINQLVRSLGMVFIPVLNKVLPYLNAVARVLKWIIDEIAALFGYTLPGVDWSGVTTGVEEGIGGIEKEIEDTTGAAEKLKNTLASFDEINLIGSKSGGTGKGKVETPGGGGFDFELPTYDFLGEATENRAKAIAETIKKHITPAVEFLKDAIMFIRDNWDAIFETTKALIVTIAAVKFISKLNTIVDMLKNINKEAVGLAIAIAGVTVAFQGGMEIADGNYLKGIIESVLGTALAAVGGFIAFGPAGAVIGIMVGIVASLTGFAIENEKNYKEKIDDIFYAYDKSKLSMDEFVQSWNNFAGSLTSNSDAVINAFKSFSEPKESIDTLLDQLSSLDKAYETGKISTEEYATELSRIMNELGDNIAKAMDGAIDVIDVALSGTLGNILTQAGYTVTQVKGLMADTKEKMAEAIVANQEQMDRLTQYYEDGTISLEDYEKGMGQLKEEVVRLTGNLSQTSEAIVDLDKVANRGVNLENLEAATKGIAEMQSTYNTSLKKLKDERYDIIQAFEFAKNLDPEMSEYYDKWISETNKGYDQLETTLNDRYALMLNDLQISVGSGLLDVFKIEGIEGLVTELDGDAGKIYEAISNAFDEAGLSDKKEKFIEILQEMTSSVGSYEEFLENREFYFSLLPDSMRDGTELEESRKAVGDEVEVYLQGLARMEAGRNMTEEQLKGYADVISQTFQNIITSDMSEQDLDNYIKGIVSKYPELYYHADEIKKIIAESANIDLSSPASESVDLMIATLQERKDDVAEESKNIGTDLFDNYATMIDPVAAGITTSLFTDAIKQRLLDEQGNISDASSKLGESVYEGFESKTKDVSNVSIEWINSIADIFSKDDTVKSASETWVGDINDAMSGKVNIFEATGKSIRETIINSANETGTNSFGAFGLNVVSTISTGINDNLTGLKEPAENVSNEMYTYLSEGLEAIKVFGDEVIKVVSDQIEDGARNGKLKPATDAIANTLYTDLTDSLSAMENYGYSVLTNIRTGLDNAGEKDRVLQSVRNMKNSIKGEFSTMADDIEKTVNDMLKRLANQFNQFQIKGQFDSKAPNLNQANIPGYASGGFPTSGELFVANENGIAEYIGSMGGKTAVANNTEIIQGVSDGVYKALRETGLVQDVKALTKKKSDVVFAPSKEAGRVMQQSANLYNGAGGRY